MWDIDIKEITVSHCHHIACIQISYHTGRSDGAAEAVHAGGDGAGADGAQPVQGEVHGAPGGSQVSQWSLG